MIFWIIKNLQKLLKAINSESNTPEVALGITLGITIGLLPFNLLLSTLLILIIVIFRSNIGGIFLGALLASFLGLVLDPLAALLGRALLEAAALNEFWTTLYNLPIVPLSNFNRVVNCGYIVSLPLLFYPIYRLFVLLISQYRLRFAEKVKKSWLYKTLKLSSVATISQKVK